MAAKTCFSVALDEGEYAELLDPADKHRISIRLRGNATGGAEVDLIFESTRLVFSRWQVQCKNTVRVSLDDVAKEVGLTHFLKSNAIVMVTTGEIGGEARRYADRIMADSNLCIIMVDGSDLARIELRPSAIVDVFDRETRNAIFYRVPGPGILWNGDGGPRLPQDGGRQRRPKPRRNAPAGSREEASVEQDGQETGVSAAAAPLGAVREQS